MIQLGSLFLSIFILVIFSSSLYIISLLISYIDSKSTISKTPLDYVFRDTLVSLIVFLIPPGIIFFTFQIYGHVNFSINIVLCVVGMSTFIFFFSSCFTTIVLKYLFIVHSQEMFGINDNILRIGSICIKIVMCILTICLDNFGPIQKVPIYMNYLSSKEILER